MLAAGENSGALKFFQDKVAGEKILPLMRDDIFATVYLKNGQKRKEEFGFGSSFLSQSGRFVQLNTTIQSVEITNNKNQKRIVKN